MRQSCFRCELKSQAIWAVLKMFVLKSPISNNICKKKKPSKDFQICIVINGTHLLMSEYGKLLAVLRAAYVRWQSHLQKLITHRSRFHYINLTILND